MVISNLQLEITKGLISLTIALITLSFGWLVGNKLSYNMNIRQKQREIDLNISHDFFRLYGEFFAIWKLYDYLLRSCQLTDDLHLEILKRMVNAEAGIESILIKIAADMRLSKSDIENLGSFRQSYQFLRKSIQSKQRVGWNKSNHEEYMRFKELSCKIAHLLTVNENCPTDKMTFDAFVEITDNNWEYKWIDPTISFEDFCKKMIGKLELHEDLKSYEKYLCKTYNKK